MHPLQKATLSGFVIIGLLYFYYDFIFVNLQHGLTRKQRLGGLLWEGDNTEEVLSGPDIFDYCPFEPPDPWPEQIIRFIDDKYGFNQTCVPNKHLRPITVLRNRRVTTNGSHRKAKDLKCQARCISYASDFTYATSEWKNINGSLFDCDIVETKCTSDIFSRTNGTNRFIHMQIVEQKPDIKPNNSGMFDVHLLIIDSVGSLQFIRALPRTTNFLIHGMEAIQFLRLNKVGYNSKPNGFPALFGEFLASYPILFKFFRTYNNTDLYTC
ncbi:hypothetical protein Y032_0060g3096 [Ancylostoma ceylanicum]|uniref:Uncharacterized protein n=1 Tax=Ancylostoma ceylanicum TaxID=53326 RepID=A0A016U3F7_9BILA|nr:hypothetical protein Y032_0060g3096 [Ancylostoma ceylanicum]